MLQVESVVDPREAKVPRNRPWVFADLIIGCGMREANCPVGYEAVVRVRSADH